MTLPDSDQLRRLLGWTPPGGVLSVSVAIDPADRGGGWRVALEDALKPAVESSQDAPHDARLAMRAVAESVLDRFPPNAPQDGRGHIGFVEVAGKDRREEWSSYPVPPRRTEVVHGHRPYLRPLIEMLDDGAAMGVVAVGGDQARLWEWELGRLSELVEMELEPTGDWRERKAPRPSQPSRVSGPGSSGRDQHDQRLEAHRERFLKQVAGRVVGEASDRGWVDLLVFGEVEHVSRFVDDLGPHSHRHVFKKNVVAEPSSRIAERIEELLPGLQREREMGLVETVKESAYSGKERASLGPQETLEALAEGRVAHLLFDAERDYSGHPIAEGLAYEGPPLDDGLPVTELLIERALETGARISAVEGDAASALDEHDGVAALLRY